MERIKEDSIGTSCSKASFKHIYSEQYPRVRRDFTPIKEFLTFLIQLWDFSPRSLTHSLIFLSFFFCCAHCMSQTWNLHERSEMRKICAKKIKWHNSLIIVKFLSVQVSYSHTPMLEDVLQILMQTVRLFSRLTDVYYSMSTVMRFPTTAGTVRDV